MFTDSADSGGVITADFQMLKTLSQSFAIHRNMPVDYTTYLLSSSPPASSYELLFCNKNEKISGLETKNVFSFAPMELELQGVGTSCDQLKPIIQRCNSCEEDETYSMSSSSCCSSGRESPLNPPSPRIKKKVSFADHRGLALATVKIMTEPSDVPPRLKPEILASITQGASAGVTTQPPLVLDFVQPASDYLSFRDRLEREFVSLENVIIRDYNVLGTVKVKNISFEKKVFLRYTIDSWETHNNVDAKYVSYSTDTSNIFDTFSFEFEVPPNFDQKKKIEFAVCFQSDDKQYWDNYSGKNYKIFSADFKSSQDNSTSSFVSDLSKLRNVDSWTDFAPWNRVDTSVPYW